MSELIVLPKLDNLQRREIARAELASIPGLGILRYLLTSSNIRSDILPSGLRGYALIDVLNITSDSQNEPRIMWQQYKSRLKMSENELYQKMIQLKLPSWENGKLYATDVMDKGWLFWFIGSMNNEVAKRFKAAFANELNHHPDEYHDQIIAELDREVGWAGTRNRLLMQEIYETGDYDNPIQPPGQPK